MTFCKEHGAFGSEMLEWNGLIVSLNGQFVVYRNPYRLCRNVAQTHLIGPCIYTYMGVQVRFSERRCVFSLLLHSGRLGVHSHLPISMDTEGSFTRYKVTGRDLVYSSPPRTVIKNSGAMPLQGHTAYVCLCAIVY